MEEFTGKNYVLTSQENFDDYLVFLEKGYLARKAALTLKPEQCLTLNADGTYTLSFTSVLVTSSITFTPGEEFQEVKPDGVKVTSTITIEGNKLIHIQREDKGRVSTHIREYFPDKMIVTTTAEGLDKTARRYYELLQ